VNAGRAKRQAGVVKSAARTLEVLELLGRAEAPLGVTEIARTLGYPQSSASILLHSLEQLGYLVHDRRKRTYGLSARAALLGARARPRLFASGPLLRAMEELAELTGELVFLMTRNQLDVRLLHVIEGGRAIRSHPGSGYCAPMAATGTGRLFLSQLPDRQVHLLVRRIQAEAGGRQRRAAPADILAEVAEVRRQGFAVSPSVAMPDARAVIRLVPGLDEDEPLAVAVSGPTETIRGNQDAFARAIGEALCRHLRPQAGGA